MVTERDPGSIDPLAASLTKLSDNGFGDLKHMIAADGGVSVKPRKLAPSVV